MEYLHSDQSGFDGFDPIYADDDDIPALEDVPMFLDDFYVDEDLESDHESDDEINDTDRIADDEDSQPAQGII